MDVLLSILIVYGITLIIVQGKIFSGIKQDFSKLILKLSNYYDPTDEYLQTLILSDKTNVCSSLKEYYTKLLKKIEKSNSDDPKIKEVLALVDETIVAAKEKLLASKPKRMKIYTKVLAYILRKIEYLISCMMCMGFWVGLGFCVLTFFFNISIFGHAIQIITGTENVCVSMFFIACLFSGTTWIIHSVVDLLSDFKENMGLFFKK